MMPFTENFSLYNAYMFAVLAERAYDDMDSIKLISAILNFTDYYFYDEKTDDNDTQYFIISNDTDVILSFRGTTNVQDWITNINCDYYDTKICGRIHDGFFKAYKEVAEGIFNKLEEFQYFKKRLWITGHSLGASIATITAMNVRLTHCVKGVYTFGSPRVGDKKFKNLYDDMLGDRTFRFVNNNDIVTHLPFKNTPFLNYYHVGKLKYIKYDGTIVNGLSCYDNFIDKLKGRWHHLGVSGTDGIMDHFMTSYKPLLKHALYKGDVKWI